MSPSSFQQATISINPLYRYNFKNLCIALKSKYNIYINYYVYLYSDLTTINIHSENYSGIIINIFNFFFFTRVSIISE